MNKPPNFVLIGKSGCGKGTQAELLMDKISNLYHISTGDLFRDLSGQKSDAGERVKKVIDSGGLPYDELATALWMNNIAYKVGKDQGIIADGFPRRLNEAKNFESFLEFLDRQDSTFYILIDISREEAVDRLTKRRICNNCGKLIPWVDKLRDLKQCDNCGGDLATRLDDTLEAINNRLDFYDNRVAEVVKFYEDNGKLIKINGEQSIEVIHEDIIKAINL